MERGQKLIKILQWNTANIGMLKKGVVLALVDGELDGESSFSSGLRKVQILESWWIFCISTRDFTRFSIK